MKQSLDAFGQSAVCQHCGGTGKALDHAAVGKWIRGFRQRASLTLRETASKAGMSAQYLHDLEQGRRQWRGDLFDKVQAVISEAK